MDAVITGQLDFNNGQAWILIAVGMIALGYLMMRSQAKKRRDPMEDAPFRLNLAQQRSVERQMSNLLVELSEMSRTISAQLDTRAKRLEALIIEADEKIEALRRAREGGYEISEGSVLPPPGGVQAEPAPATLRFPRLAEPEPVDPRHADVYTLADAGNSAAQIAQKLSRPTGEVELILALRPRTRAQ